jgi:predicted DCC family thiol-disulfide oxidoreductase YuxK
MPVATVRTPRGAWVDAGLGALAAALLEKMLDGWEKAVVGDPIERGESQPADLSRRGRPVLVYDGDCAFCTSCARLLEKIGPEAEIVAWQLTDLAELGIAAEQAAAAVQWVQIDGTVRSGHEAIAATLSTAGRIWRIVGHALLLPGISWMAGRAYRLVADNRHRLPGGTPACAATDEDRDRPAG